MIAEPHGYWNAIRSSFRRQIQSRRDDGWVENAAIVDGVVNAAIVDGVVEAAIVDGAVQVDAELVIA